MIEPESKRDTARLGSLDAYRGFVMLTMASAALGIPQVADHFPGNETLQSVAFQLDHVPWRGGSAWDLIQPSFMFIVGVAMPFSYASRRAQGQSWSRLLAHAIWRSMVLVLLGIFLSSAWSERTNFMFVNVLTQIGLGYPFVFLLLDRSPQVQLAAALAILAGYWLLFVLYPAADARANPNPDRPLVHLAVDARVRRATGRRTRTSRRRSTAGSSTCSPGPTASRS